MDGSNEQDLRSETIRFLRQKMGVDASDCGDSQNMRVRRALQARRSNVKFEVLVCFDSKTTRDCVASHARNLSDYRNDEGQPVAGMRFDHPGHLGKDFRILDWYASTMRRKHGKGTRTNFKFDDDNELIYLDVCRPGEDFWHKVAPGQARDFREKFERNRTRSSIASLESEEDGTQAPTRDNDSVFSSGANRVPIGKRQERTQPPREQNGEGQRTESSQYKSPVRRQSRNST